MILTIRTDQPEAEVSVLDPEGKEISSQVWPAHKELSVTILDKLTQILEEAGLGWSDISGVVAYQGPGSFTGLRIGITVANTIAYSQKIPIVGSTGQDWIPLGIAKLENAKVGQYIVPEYGGDANITKPRK